MDRRGNESLKPPGTRLPDLKGHLPALDGYRGVAMILALLHHFILPFPGMEHRPGLHQVAEVGRIGLDLFFVLSGFLITGILLDTRGQPHYFRNFYARRSLRIVPLYYAVLLFFFVLLPPFMFRSPATASMGILWADEAHKWPWYFGYASNFLFYIRNAFAPAGLDVTWSLGIEEQYYLSWAVLVFLIGSRGLSWICVGLVTAALAVRALLLSMGASWIQVHVMTFARMDALSMGGLIAVLVRSPSYSPKAMNRGGLIALIGSVLALVALAPLGSVRHDSKVTLLVGYTLVGLFCAGGLVALIHTPDTSIVSRIFRTRFLRFFGKYSYAIYLFHIPVRDEIRRRWFPKIYFQEAFGWELLWRQLFFFTVTTLVVVVMALVSWNLFERQWLKLKDRFPRFSRRKVEALETNGAPAAQGPASLE